MLEQLLEQRGARTRRLLHADVSRERIGQCELDTADAVIVSYLDIDAAFSQIKYLVRRLHHQAPNARIIVGIMPKAPPTKVPAPLPAAIGADAYVSSLREALEACSPSTDGSTSE